MLPVDSRKMAWPPAPWKRALERMEEHDAWARGDLLRLGAIYKAKIPNRFLAKDVEDEMTDMVNPGIAQEVVRTGASLLFGEPASYYVKGSRDDNAPPAVKAAQERLDNLIAKNSFHSRAYEAAEINATLGAVAYKLDWDASLADHVLISAVRGDQCIPYTRFGKVVGVLFWRIVEDDEESGKVWRHLEYREPGKISHGLYQGTSDLLGPRLPLSAHVETAGFQDEVILPAGKMYAYYTPNKRPNPDEPSLPVGRSDLAGLESMMDQAAQILSIWGKEFSLGQGRLFAPIEFLQKMEEGQWKFKVNKSLYTPLDVHPDEANKLIDNVQFEIRHEPFVAALDALLRRIVSTAGYSIQTVDPKFEGSSGESGTALKLRERKSMMTRMHKQLLYTPVIEQMLTDALELDARLYGAGGAQGEVYMEWADSVADDPNEVARYVETSRRAGAMSLHAAVRRLNPDMTDAEVEAEVQRCMDENGAMPSPLDLGDVG